VDRGAGGENAWRWKTSNCFIACMLETGAGGTEQSNMCGGESGIGMMLEMRGRAGQTDLAAHKEQVKVAQDK